ncbi:MAG: hypothetical protein ACK5MD_10095 [Flavobacteriales bacterium]
MAEEKLADIAEKYNVSIDEIKKENSDVRFFKAFLGSEYVAAMQSLKIPIPKVYEIPPKQGNSIPEGKFIPNARYRCSQSNLILIDGKSNFSCEIKTQYLFSILEKKETQFKSIELEDYVTAIEPKNMQDAFDMIKRIELLRNNIIFTNTEDKIEKIHNIGTLQKDWELFSKHKINSLHFFKELQERNPQSIREFISNGDKEFSNEKQLSEVIDKNLFFHVLLKSLNENLEEYSIVQKSQIFPSIDLKANVTNSKVTEDELATTYRLVGTLEKESIDEKILQNLYSNMYQPLIKFSYTEFDFIYRITYIIENKTGLLKNANVSIKESVKNDYEVITKFELKQVEL